MKVTAASAEYEKRCKMYHSKFVETSFLLGSCVIHSKGPLFRLEPCASLGVLLIFSLFTGD